MTENKVLLVKCENRHPQDDVDDAVNEMQSDGWSIESINTLLVAGGDIPCGPGRNAGPMWTVCIVTIHLTRILRQ